MLGLNFSLPNKIFVPTIDEGSIKIIGVDIGLPVISSNIFNLTLYADYSKIINFGHGIASGFSFNLKNLGLLKLFGKFERRFNSDNYIHSYFNSLYEIERFRYFIPGTFLKALSTSPFIARIQPESRKFLIAPLRTNSKLALR